MNKFLHEPSVRLKAAAANGRGLGVVDAARYLFALEKGAAGDQHLAADQRAAAADQHAPITEHPTSGEPTEIA
jgi:hypothetical protein